MFHHPNDKRLVTAILCLSFAFIAAGMNHFIQPKLYVSIMPAYLPWHWALVYLSGGFEILGGLGILVGRLRRSAGLGLIVLTIAVFPANLQMALHADSYRLLAPAWVWYLRLPLQLFILAWIYWACLRVVKSTTESF